MSDNPADIIGLATKKGVTLGCAESLTGGLVASALIEVPGASAVFKGSIVAYDLMVKHDLVGVSAALLAENPKPTEAEIRHYLEGNICRCTGYHNIVKAVLAASGQDAAALAAE